ncbi:cytochrome c peroxidase [Aquimarina addita]|uniref:Cytochrome c peroxidase n=2 Tax=Aquimarina addita TaxID=870485 RepID=A0ABP7XFM8_9FLAO
MDMKKQHVTILLLLISGIVLYSCHERQKKSLNDAYEDLETVSWIRVQEYYKNHIKEAIIMLDSVQLAIPNQEKTTYFFKKARIAFKKAEPYASYLNPDVGHKVNGPALPTYKEDSGRIMDPIGLQTMEEYIYDGDINNPDFKKITSITKGMFAILKKDLDKRKLNPERFFVSTHQQLFRLVSLAMAGFDTPISQLSIQETSISLQSLQYVYEHSIQPIILKKKPVLNASFIKSINKAVQYIGEHDDFINFDRFTFIRDYLNPITRDWVAIRKESDLWKGSSSFAMNFDAPTFFEENSFNMDFFKSAKNRKPSKDQIELGNKLFFDPKISKNKTISCATCHLPEKAYADDVALSSDNSGIRLQRNTPTLMNAAFQKAFFWDGRSATLTDQVNAVFKNKKEFDTEIHQFSGEILQDTTYYSLLQKAYGKLPKGNQEIIRAISSYVATLKGFNSKFDQNIRGEIDTFSDSEKRGFNLYMGKALCATCHFIPLTNGTVPPFFKETEKEVIGVPATTSNKKLDDDVGFYTMFEEEIHKGMFKTPTIRNASLTAPYMHNGVYNTLEQVLEFYNLGGGGGLGFDLEYQTLPFDNLELSDQEQKDIIAFIHTLEDVTIDTKNY